MYLEGNFEGEVPLGAPCRGHERRWRNRCVDKGLKDEWLERLNELTLFDLISVCEGHATEPEGHPRRLPHINLRLREAYIGQVVEKWNMFKAAVGSALGECFDAGRVRGHFEIRSGYASDRKGSEPVEVALLRISARFDMEPSSGSPKNEWFEKSIAAAECFDKKLGRILEAVAE